MLAGEGWEWKGFKGSSGGMKAELPYEAVILRLVGWGSRVKEEEMKEGKQTHLYGLRF
jgi:hypothetical protein